MSGSVTGFAAIPYEEHLITSEEPLCTKILLPDIPVYSAIVSTSSSLCVRSSKFYGLANVRIGYGLCSYPLRRTIGLDLPLFPVIYQNDLQIPVGLVDNAVQTFHKVILYVIDRHNNADQYIRRRYGLFKRPLYPVGRGILFGRTTD